MAPATNGRGPPLRNPALPERRKARGRRSPGQPAGPPLVLLHPHRRRRQVHRGAVPGSDRAGGTRPGGRVAQPVAIGHLPQPDPGPRGDPDQHDGGDQTIQHDRAGTGGGGRAGILRPHHYHGRRHHHGQNLWIRSDLERAQRPQDPRDQRRPPQPEPFRLHGPVFARRRLRPRLALRVSLEGGSVRTLPAVRAGASPAAF